MQPGMANHNFIFCSWRSLPERTPCRLIVWAQAQSWATPGHHIQSIPPSIIAPSQLQKCGGGLAHPATARPIFAAWCLKPMGVSIVEFSVRTRSKHVTETTWQQHGNIRSNRPQPLFEHMTQNWSFIGHLTPQLQKCLAFINLDVQVRSL